jgi:hypothetical protein
VRWVGGRDGASLGGDYCEGHVVVGGKLALGKVRGIDRSFAELYVIG